MAEDDTLTDPELFDRDRVLLDLPPLWLNDQAAMFLMKLYAARAIDRPDMIRLWPHTGFTSPGQAVERYWDAYPHAREDDHLESFVAAIAKSAAGG